MSDYLNRERIGGRKILRSSHFADLRQAVETLSKMNPRDDRQEALLMLARNELAAAERRGAQ